MGPHTVDNIPPPFFLVSMKLSKQTEHITASDHSFNDGTAPLITFTSSRFLPITAVVPILSSIFLLFLIFLTSFFLSIFLFLSSPSFFSFLTVSWISQNYSLYLSSSCSLLEIFSLFPFPLI